MVKIWHFHAGNVRIDAESILKPPAAVVVFGVDGVLVSCRPAGKAVGGKEEYVEGNRE